MPATSARRRRCRPSCTRRPRCWRSSTRRSSPTTGCASGGPSRVAELGDWFTVDIVDEPIVIVRDKEGEIRAMSAVCQHRAMQVCDGDGQLVDVQVPVPPLELRPRRPAARRAGDGTHRSTSTSPSSASRSSRSSSGRGSCSSTSTPTPRRSRRRSSATTPLLANYDLDHAVRHRHVHAARPAVELEGDVRELQRRLPRQPPPPVRAGLLPELDDAASRSSGTTTPTSSSAPPATPTSTAGSTPPIGRSCRSSRS